MNEQSRDDLWHSAIQALQNGEYGVALSAFEELADDGDSLAMAEIGRLYESGCLSMGPNYTEAIRWYKRAVEGGVVEGMLGYARLIFLGRGEDRDYTAARIVYEEIVDQIEEPRALFCLAQIYQFGLGVETDNNRAMELYRRAAKSGHLLALKFLSYLYWHNGMRIWAIPIWSWAILRIIFHGLFNRRNPNLGQVM